MKISIQTVDYRLTKNVSIKLKYPSSTSSWENTMRLLLIEDDTLLGDGIHVGLTQANYAVDWMTDGDSGERALKSESYNALILDLTLPKKDGLKILKTLRARGDTLPVLILTARDAVNDKVTGLDHGADDYLVKPFDLDELNARLRALLRRHHGRATPYIEYGNLRLDPAAHLLTRDGEPIVLSQREFVVLQTLLENQGRVLSRARLEEGLYGWDTAIESNAVEVHIHHLRKKLGKDIIQTLRGVGYRIPKRS
jgi:DNA-binding response OmpR family regulator